VPPAKAGVGSAVINSMRQVGGSLGIAIMGAIVATSYGGGNSPAGAASYVDGMQLGLRVAAGIAFGAVVIAAVTVRGARAREHGEARLAEAPEIS
jgi:hypothetical protein